MTHCDFSDNYQNPKHGWGELPPRGDLLVEPTAVHRPQQPAAEPAPDAAATDEFPPDPVSC